MRTKAIRKVIRDIQCDYIPCREGMCRKHEALAEVEAIEKAARALHAGAIGGGWETPGVQEAFETMEQIAKDAP